MNPNLVLFLLFVVVPAIPLLGQFLIDKYIISQVKKQYIIPILKGKNYIFIRVKKINTFLFFMPKEKGDFDDELTFLFHDTRLNRKDYYYLYYLDNNGVEHRCTVKIWADPFASPIKVKFKPDIS
jgi:hypothetical protein